MDKEIQQRTRKIKIAYEDSIGESLEARTGIVSAGNTGSSDSESSKDGDKLFFRVNNVKFHGETYPAAINFARYLLYG